MADDSELEGQLDALEGAMADAGAMTAALSGEILKMQGAMAATGRDAEVLSKGLSRGLKSAFDGLVFDGMRVSDALNAVARSLVNTAYSAAIKPVTNQIGSLLAQGVAGLFANGAAFSQGKVMPFASGGVVSGATYFPMRGGTGLMGEAGPEAIMPLARGADGKLGVRAAGSGRPVQVVMNISTPDAASFQRSQSQIAAQMSRALGRAQRNR
ncbi:phage tail tape measure protein [Silicimonas sp. MF1-12-2]|uniref:phage tail tape measure protein n=1 Tax=Silicimonas sp. MF1-12-2 TaxID=3384793 RepID=UPI0039B6955C